MADIPKGIGKGEGGGNLHKLEEILKEYEQRISELEQRVTTLEGGA